MTRARLSAVAWTEGMFLGPQHFQQADGAAQERLLYQIRALNPFLWGIRELQLDEEALTDSRIVVLRLEAILPDGTIVTYPGNAAVESRKFDPTLERLSAYIGVRVPSPNEGNSADPESGRADTRYLIDNETVPDLHRPDSENDISIMRPNVRVFLSGEEPELEMYDSFKLAEIEATGDAARPFALSKSYVPPLLAIQASQPLLEEVEVAVSQMASKVRQAAAGRQAMTQLEYARLLMWYTVARLTPVLRHLIAIGETHPYELYTALVETAASLTAMNHDELVELPSYEHDNLYRSYHAILDLIDQELQGEFKDRSREFTMDWVAPTDTEKGYYQAPQLNTDHISRDNAFYVAIKSDLDADELERLVGDEARLGSASAEGVRFLNRFNAPGLKMSRLPSAPGTIKQMPGFEFYQIDPKSHEKQWTRVTQDYSFGLSLGRLESADVRLIVVLAEE